MINYRVIAGAGVSLLCLSAIWAQNNGRPGSQLVWAPKPVTMTPWTAPNKPHWKLAEILAERRSVTEGVTTAGAVMDMAARIGVEMPICAGVDAVIIKGVSLDDVIRALLSRPFRSVGL